MMRISSCEPDSNTNKVCRIVFLSRDGIGGHSDHFWVILLIYVGRKTNFHVLAIMCNFLQKTASYSHNYFFQLLLIGPSLVLETYN